MATTTMKKPVNNYLEIQQKVMAQLNTSGSGSTSTSGISSIPTTPGVYRVTNAIAGLPAGANGYGTLLVFDGGGYLLYFYVDANRDFYYAENTSAAPTKWYKLSGTEVGLRT